MSIKNAGLTVVEFLIACCVIFVLVGVFGIYANKLLVDSREVALKNELAALRISLDLYKILKDNKPKSLRGFFEVKKDRLDNKGNFLDTFGNPYVYDPSSGKIYSTTPGYETW